MSKKVQWSSITAVFGGTFDPPHLSHRHAVEGLFKNPGVERVLIIPAAIPPLKQTQTSSLHRLQMTELNFAGIKNVAVDTCEMEREKSKKPSFTYDTLLELKQREMKIAFVCGTDQVETLPKWYRFPEILGLCHWIFLERKPNGAERIYKMIQEFETSGLIKKTSDREWVTKTGTVLCVTPTLALEGSSTEVRKSFALKGLAENQMLYPAVEQYLKQHRLYGAAVL